MSCTTQPLRLLAGESRTLRITVTDGDGDIVDVSAAGGVTAIEFQVKTVAGAVDPPLIAKTLGGGIAYVTDGTDGEFDVSIAPADFTTIAAGTYAYDVVVVKATKRHYVIAPSDFVVAAVVNQP